MNKEQFPMIQINEVTKSFGKLIAIDNMSLSIGPREFFGLLGPNGAGKSTLMNLLTGYLNADSGTIEINGLKVSKGGVDFRRRLGYVPQSIALYDELTAVENLTIFGRLYDLPSGQLKASIEEKLRAVQLNDRRKDIVKNFSGGMKRRLNLAAGLLHNPDVILCDEPTVGVDPQSRNAIFEYLSELNASGKTIIYTTHYMEEAERLCSNIAVIDAGKIIAQGTVDGLLRLLPYEDTLFVTKRPGSEMPVELLKTFGEVNAETDRIEIKPAAGKALSSLFAILEKNKISYRDIELHKPTLEALFLHLTGKKLRD
jgi:ABC-2 type transport system ATP-binding protein